MIYFDNAATTVVDENILNVMLPYFKIYYGNPSALHSTGREAKNAINAARNNISNSINCKKNEVFFAASASECNNIALEILINSNKSKGNHILCSNIEHPSVLNTVEKYKKYGYKIDYAEADDNGIVTEKELQVKLRNDTCVVAIMHVNNEIGSVQDIQTLCRLSHNNGSMFYSDTVQSIGHCKIDFKSFDLDAMCISSHKIYGPKGIACLILNENIKYNPFIYGGGQERNLISGTENVPGIVAISKAIEMAIKYQESNSEYLTKLRTYFLDKISNLKIPFELNSDLNNSVPNIVNIRLNGKRNDVVLSRLDMMGICVSAGSACSSGIIEKHGTVSKIKNSDIKAAESIRISFSKYNTFKDIDYLVNALQNL